MGEEGDAANKPGDQPKKGDSAFAKKIMKIMTIMAYISGVSGPGFLLSLYYIIFFEPNIQGIRPPGYLKSGEMVGLPQAQARVDPMPQSFVNAPPIYDKKMSREFMAAYYRNLTASKAGDSIAAGEQSNVLEPEPTPMALPLFPETRNHHLNSHHSHHNGQTAQSNNNHQSSGPSPQQGGMGRDTSSPEDPFMPEESRQHHHQQQHGQPPLSASA